MTTEEKFNAAVNVIRSLPKNGPYQPSNDLMLKFYGYYKQATEGPCTGRRPAFYDLVGRAKYDAWKRLGNMSRSEAMARYVEELHSIIETMSYSDKVASFLEAPTNELDSINTTDLELIAGDVIDRFRSHPNSPFASREASPTRTNETTIMSPMNPSVQFSDHSDDDDDDEYIDTIEYPETRKYYDLPNGTAHVSRTRQKLSQSSNHTDISIEITKAVQHLQTDIERLSTKITMLEHSNTKQLKRNTGISFQLFILMIVWPFVANFIMNRYVFNRKK